MNKISNMWDGLWMYSHIMTPCISKRLHWNWTKQSMFLICCVLLQDLNYARQLYSTTLQQTLMLVLILGRWLQPRGELTRDQLSQLLLVYIGMAADMLEFSSETLRLDQIACTEPIFVGVLAVWSWSLTQFSLGLTSTKARKTRATGSIEKDASGSPTPPASPEMLAPATSIDSLVLANLSPSRIKLKLLSSGLCGTELWAVMISLLVQDGPYLVTRLYIIFRYNIFDHSMIFFTCKNALLLFLMAYRLFVVMYEARKKNKSKLMRLRDRTQPAGQDKQGQDSVSNGSFLSNKVGHRKYKPKNDSEIVVDIQHSDTDFPRSGANQNDKDDNYLGPFVERRFSTDDGQMTSEELGGRLNHAYDHDQDSSEDMKNNYSEDDDDNDDDVRNGAYIVTGHRESLDSDVTGRPPTPPPLPPLVKSSPSRGSPAGGSRLRPSIRVDADRQNPNSIYAEIRRKPTTTQTIQHTKLTRL